MTQVLKSPQQPWKTPTVPLPPPRTPSAGFPWTVPTSSGLLETAGTRSATSAATRSVVTVLKTNQQDAL